MITQLDEKTVLVEAGEPDPSDILEYAELLIDVEGWNDYAKTQTGSSPDAGWTLHDAIGEANRRLFGRTNVVGSPGGDKDGVTLANGDTTRTAATEQLSKALGRKSDVEFNDRASSSDEIISVLRKARGV